MSKSKEASEPKRIYPMMLPLDTLQAEVYFTALPAELKEQLILLECTSNGKFKRYLNYSLPFQNLHNMLNQYLDILHCNDIKSGDREEYWLASATPIDSGLLTQLVIIWIEAFYIQETELTKLRKNDEEGKVSVRKQARSVCEYLEAHPIPCANKSEAVILCENGVVQSKLCFDVVPMMAVNQLHNQRLTLGTEGQYFQLMKSGTHSLCTEPEKIFDTDQQTDSCSLNVYLSVQTLPPNERAYLNVELSKVRWHSRSYENKESFAIHHNKTAYLRINNSLQAVHLLEHNKILSLAWKDKQWLNGLYTYKEPDFVEVLKNPKQYWCGSTLTRFPLYLLYDTQMAGFKHNSKAGVYALDRKNSFEQISRMLSPLLAPNGEIPTVVATDTGISGSHGHLKYYFIDSEKSGDSYLLRAENSTFSAMVEKALDGRSLTVEIWYDFSNDKGRILGATLERYLNNHFDGMEQVRIHARDLGEWGTCLEQVDKKGKKSGTDMRINAICAGLSRESAPHLSYVVLHSKEYFEKIQWERIHACKHDKLAKERTVEADPKTAIRIAFAQCGRLTQFITLPDEQKQESEQEVNTAKNKKKKKEEKTTPFPDKYIIRSTLLDGYRQLGIPLDLKNLKDLKGKCIIGARVKNHVTGIHRREYQPFPVFCMLEDGQVRVFCDVLSDEVMYYDQFQLELATQLSGRKAAKAIAYSPEKVKNFLQFWFEEHTGVLMLENNDLSRKVFRNISNKAVQAENQKKSSFTMEFVRKYRDNLRLTLPNEQLLGIVRLRTSTNHEIPDYFTTQPEGNLCFSAFGRIFQCEEVYYSLDSKSDNDQEAFKAKNSIVNMNKQATHRRPLEMYPLYYGESDVRKLLKCTHDLRTVAIQASKKEMVKLPFPMMLIDAALNDYCEAKW